MAGKQTDRFGKLLPGSVAHAVDGRLFDNAALLFLWSTLRQFPANKKPPYEQQQIREWLACSDMSGTPLEEIHVAQFSYKDAAAALFNGNVTEAKRQAGRLVEWGVWLPVGKPLKGHPQMYYVIPYPDIEGKCLPKKKDTNAEKGTHPDVYPSGDGVSQSEGNGYITYSEWVHIRDEIGTHAKPVTCGNETLTDISNSNPNR